MPPICISVSRSASNWALPVESSESGKIIPTKSKISVLAEQVYFIYGRPSPAAMAFAPIVLPVPAGPRSRKFRICMDLPVVALACLQMSTTSFGMMYHSGSFGISIVSCGVKVRLFSTYCPSKSAWSMVSVAE